jgi:hypothetical protein
MSKIEKLHIDTDKNFDVTIKIFSVRRNYKNFQNCDDKKNFFINSIKK